MTKKISIITATFNGATTLKKCLNSVFNQTCIDDIEHIIVDGGSMDETLNIVAEFAHLSQVISEPDEGIYDAFNKGMQLATSEYIYFLNSDDYLFEVDIISHVLSELITNEYDYFTGLVVEENTQTNERSIQKPIELNFRGKVLKRPCHQGFFMKTALLKKMGGFPRCFDLAADAYVMLKQMIVGKGLFSDIVVARFLLNGASTKVKSMDKIADEFSAIYTLLGLQKVRNELTVNIELRRTMANMKEFLRLSVDPKTSFKINSAPIAIFGTGKMAVIIHQILTNRGLNIECFVVTRKDCDVFLGIEIVELDHFIFNGYIINTIEGEHYSEVNNVIGQNNHQVKFLRWNEIYE